MSVEALVEILAPCEAVETSPTLLQRHVGHGIPLDGRQQIGVVLLLFGGVGIG